MDLFSLSSKGTIGITAITMVNTRPIDSLSFLHSRSEGEGKDKRSFDVGSPVIVMQKLLCVSLYNN